MKIRQVLHRGLRGRHADRVNLPATLLRDLPGALGSGQLMVEYQPLFDLSAPEVPVGVPVAVEALCRWQHPELGVLGPDRFIPIAEEAGLLDELDREVLARAGAQVRRWQQDGHGALGLSVNASPTRWSEGFVDAITTTADEAGLRRGTLVVEVTETPAPQVTAAMIDSLPRLHESGVAVSIDDFGAGDTTIEMLDGLAIDEVKVDRSLTQRSDADADREVTALVRMAFREGWRVVAEGIETVADLTRARARGCDRGQGFLWARPMGAAALGRLLAPSR